ncbi:hypothetical protein [Phycicoccus avicenniae]|uniref:hypothetical protein n=1 Tax=Phycicoccus avicenniae TaxID=2828860 RepID=UPI003D290FD7
MAAFSVQSGTLTDFAGVLGQGGHSIDLASAFTGKARTYVDTYMPVPYDSGDLYADVYLNNRQVVTALQSSTTAVGQLLQQSGQALTASATRYAKLDAAAAAQLDASYPGGQASVPAPSSGLDATGGALENPEPALNGEPSKDAPVPDMVQWIMDKAGWASITGLAVKLASLFGLDPWAALTKCVVGDYGELAQAGHAAKALGDFEKIAAQTLVTGAGAMVWTGEAAEHARQWFVEAANALEEHADKLDDLSQKYALLVQHCAELAAALGGLLETAIDEILICAAELAAAGCLASVPGINVIIGLIGAYQVWKTTEAVAAFLKVTGNVYMGVTGLLAAVTGLASWAEDGDVTTKLPTAPYVNASL